MNVPTSIFDTKTWIWILFTAIFLALNTGGHAFGLIDGMNLDVKQNMCGSVGNHGRHKCNIKSFWVNFRRFSTNKAGI